MWRSARLGAGLSVMVALGGCPTTVDIPDGVFACASSADCPEAFTCKEDGLCHATVDSGEAIDAGIDSASDGAP